MKQLLLIFLFTPFFSIAQNEMDIDTLHFNFSEVIKADSVSAATLYSNAKLLSQMLLFLLKM